MRKHIAEPASASKILKAHGISPKVLKDLDKGHPFYSDSAIRERKKLLKELEEKEKELVKENRARYKSKKRVAEEDDGSD